MSKAEDRALERFPVHKGASKEWIESHLKGICSDYIEGYHQAEKDLALTWQDIETIYDIFDWMANDDGLDNDPNFDYSNREQYFKEALKRFNKYKEDSRI